jgi:tetratricopeptide (TPR) repeat protein
MKLAALAIVLMPSTQVPYWATVAEYASGDRAAAVEAIQAMTRADLADALKEASAPFALRPLRAAVLLHAERERADRRKVVDGSGGQTDCFVGPHGSMAEKLLKPAAEQPGGRAFVAAFALAQSIHQRSVLCFQNALYWAELGIKSDSTAPVLYFAAGLAGESLGSFGGGAPASAGREAISAQTPREETILEQARARYEKALSLDPGLVEARVRLGRMQSSAGQPDAARKNLALAVTQAEGPVLYLARLFLGRILEEAGDLDSAIEHYRRAAEPEPLPQSANVALAHALALKGDRGAAREVLEAALARAGRREGEDPYWFYYVGNPTVGEALFEKLRAGLAK